MAEERPNGIAPQLAWARVLLGVSGAVAFCCAIKKFMLGIALR